MEKLIFTVGLVTTVVLAVLKMVGVASISLFMVFVPVLISLGIIIVTSVIILLVLLGKPMYRLWKLKRTKERKR